MKIRLVITPSIEHYFYKKSKCTNAPGVKLDVEEDDLAVMLRIARENKQEIMIKYYE